MMTDLEIADLLDGISREQVNAAIQAINGYGFNINAPWEGDQDDREYEQFCGLLNAIRAALAPVDSAAEQEAFQKYVDANEELIELRAQVDRLTTKLRFYAARENWMSPSTGFVAQYDPEPSPMERDRGECARRILEELTSTELQK